MTVGVVAFAAAIRAEPPRMVVRVLALLVAIAIGGDSARALAATVGEDGSAAAVGSAVAPTPSTQRAAHGARASSTPQRVSPLDRRVMLLATELDLDPAQADKVRALLQAQRDQVARVWSDESTPSVVRIGRTQEIGDRTADQIRALLTEQQRTRYLQARQREVSVGTPGSDVQSWLTPGKQPVLAR